MTTTDGSRRSGAEPSFSVIIPTYNRAELVTQAVSSALDQDVGGVEVIVVDDGSTDATAAALAPWRSRIRYVRQANRGVAAARNRGIAEARGELLAFLDSDDLFEPRMLGAARECFARHPTAGAVFTSERELDGAGRPLGRVHGKRSPGPFFTSASLLAQDTRIGCGRPGVVRHDWVRRLGGFDESIRCAIDCDLWIRYSFHMVMALQPEPLVLRRIHDASLSRNRRQDAEDWLLILDKLALEQPAFVRQHQKLYDRVAAKNWLRCGRELLAEVLQEPGKLAAARQALRRAWRHAPLVPRTPTYLLWSYVAPSTYARFRRWELGARGRASSGTP